MLRISVTHIYFLFLVLSRDSEYPVGVNDSTCLGKCISNAIKNKINQNNISKYNIFGLGYE